VTNPRVPLKLLRILMDSQLLRATNVCELMHFLGKIIHYKQKKSLSFIFRVFNVLSLACPWNIFRY